VQGDWEVLSPLTESTYETHPVAAWGKSLSGRIFPVIGALDWTPCTIDWYGDCVIRKAGHSMLYTPYGDTRAGVEEWLKCEAANRRRVRGPTPPDHPGAGFGPLLLLPPGRLRSRRARSLPCLARNFLESFRES
jgi:hypothetical protein